MSDSLVVGILDSPVAGQRASLCHALSSLTLAWLRYGYPGRVLQSADVAELTERAAAFGAQFLLVLKPGCVVYERWDVEAGDGDGDFFHALRGWTGRHDFVVAGWLPADGSLSAQQPPAVLVNLSRRAEALAALAQGRADPFPPGLAGHLLDLSGGGVGQARALEPLLGSGMLCEEAEYRSGIKRLTADQRLFVETVRNQVTNAKRGVFLWNIESYRDVDDLGATFDGPVSGLYTVAAGFKPNRILHTHGFTDETRVVYIDYSPRALAVKKLLVEHWDGRNYPAVVKSLFQRYPHPETFYQLWDNKSPAEVTDAELAALWQRELDRWGGEEAFVRHWRSYRKLPHEYVECDLIADPSPLWNQLRDEPNGVIWWSNAFFTMCGNWLYETRDRLARYDRFVEGLAARAPSLQVYGADANNVNVNGLTADQYYRRYRDAASDHLTPGQLFRTAVRM